MGIFRTRGDFPYRRASSENAEIHPRTSGKQALFEFPYRYPRIRAAVRQIPVARGARPRGTRVRRLSSLMGTGRVCRCYSHFQPKQSTTGRGWRRSWTSTSIRNEKTYHEQGQSGDRWQPRPVVEELKARAKAAGLVEPVPAGERARGGPDQPGIRAAVRDHGPLAVGGRGVQLLGPGHRQHGSAGALRHAGAAGSLAEAAAWPARSAPASP